MSAAARTEHPARHGVLAAIGAAVLFGLSTPAVKPFAGDASPILVAGLLYCGAALGLAALLLARRAAGTAGAAGGDGVRRSEAPLRAADLPWLGGAIVLGGIAGPILLVSGLASLPASEASLLLNLEAVLTVTLAALVAREQVGRQVVIGMAPTLLGAIVLSWEGGAGFALRPASLLVAAACLCWAIDNNLTRRVSAADPLVIAALKCGVAGSVNTGLALGLGAMLPQARAISWILCVGFVGYGLSLTLFVVALRHLGAARTGAYFATAPFVGAIASVLWLREPIEAAFAAGGILMTLGLVVQLSERHGHLHTHQPLEHSHRHRHDEHHRHAHGPDDPPGEPHAHPHCHAPLVHAHPHYPDLHHRHRHD